MCVCVLQACCSALKSLQRSLRWGTTGGASLLPPSAPSYSECWLCGTMRKVNIVFLPVHGSVHFFRSDSRNRLLCSLNDTLSPQRPSPLSLRHDSAWTSHLTFRSCQHLPSWGEWVPRDRHHVELVPEEVSSFSHFATLSLKNWAQSQV